MKKSTLIIIILVFTLAVFIPLIMVMSYMAAHYRAPVTAVPLGTVAQNADDAQSWKTYRNEEYGFAVMIPNDWTVTKDINGTGLDFVSASLKKQTEENCSGKTGSDCIPEWIPWDIHFSTASDLSFAEQTSAKEVVLNGISFKYYTELGLYEFPHYETEYNGHTFNFTFVDEHESKLILSTFKFIEPTADTSSWKTYRNEEYGFEFRYPADLSAGNGVPAPYSSSILNSTQKMSNGSFVGPLIMSVANTEVLKNAAEKRLNEFRELIGKATTSNQSDDDFGLPVCSATYIPSVARIDFVICRGEGESIRAIIYGDQFNILVENNDYLEQETIENILSTFKFTPRSL